MKKRNKNPKFILFSVLIIAFGLAAGIFLFEQPKKSVENKNENGNSGGSGGPTPATDTAKNEPVTLLAFGDLLLDRYIKREIDRKGMDYTFKNIEKFLEGNDLVLANLEGSFTDFKPRPLDPNNTSFTFDPKLASILTENHFNILNLANNHVRDFGKAGFEQSQTYLDKAGISHFGDFYNEGPAIVKDINGIRIAFIGYNEFGDPAIESTIAKVKEIKPQADYAVVYAHWGAEYQTDFWIGSQEKGRQFIDAGADAVLGSHPHVVQPIEIYKDKPIFYSLGNFVFDQIFSDQVRHGLAVKMIFNKDRIEYDLYSTEMKNFQVSLSSDEKRSEVLSWLVKNSVVSDDAKTQIKSGKFIIAKTSQ